MDYKHSLEILRSCIWNRETAFEENIDWAEQYSFFKSQAVAALPADLLRRVGMPQEVLSQWMKDVYQNVYQYKKLVHDQTELLSRLREAGVSCVVLKGTSAAQYYRRPECRAMGDIDLLVRPETFDVCCDAMRSFGWNASEEQPDEEDMLLDAKLRHYAFKKNGLTVELHMRFSSRAATEEHRRALDEILYDSISPESTVLPASRNGLVLLAHIAQHMRQGLGIRQIIDWMMFVEACLDDGMWEQEFRSLAESTGMDKLAVTVTRMCQIFLGLRTEGVSWCASADEKLAGDLMDYVLRNGNFGRSRSYEESSVVLRLPSYRHPVQLFRYIQSRGEVNWKTLEKHPRLRPFAWIYQCGHLVRLSFRKKLRPKALLEMSEEGPRRNAMFDSLGIVTKK